MFSLAKGEKLRGWKNLNGELKISINIYQCCNAVGVQLDIRDMGTVRGKYFGHGQDLLSFVSGTGTAMRYQWKRHSINGVTLSIW